MSMEVPAVSKSAPARKAAASPAAPPKIRVGFVLTPRFTLTAFAGFVDVLRLAADDGDRSRQLECQWTVLGDPGESITSSSGAEVRAWEPMESPERFDYIVVVGGLLHQGQRVPHSVYAFLKQAAKAGVPLVGLCTGSFVLARAGLLNGYVTCVSWFHREDFTREFPRLRLVTNQMYMIDRDRMTCAGGTSVVHLAAHLVEKHCGRAFANKSLRILLEDQPLPSNTPQPEAEITRKAQDWSVRRAMLLIEQKLSSPEPINEVVGSLGIGIRQLERRFFADVGMTMREFRSQLRLARAKWMIENTDLSLTHIGLECGFGGCSHFSRAFTARFNVRPSAIRRSVQAHSHHPGA
jgi:transcriptional regulator GlxA family with amidase domain